MTGVIKNLDQPKPQVLIKVVFLEVTYNKGSDVGVEGSYTFNLKNPIAATTGNTRRPRTPTNGTIAGGDHHDHQHLNHARIGTAAAAGQTLDRLAAPLRPSPPDQAASSASPATTGPPRSAPSPAKEKSRSSRAPRSWRATIRKPSSSSARRCPSSPTARLTSTGQTNNTIQYDNVGIILRVTPFITSEGTVEMIVAPEISTLTDQTVPIGNNTFAPVISKRSAETVVVTPHAQTVVIGGLMQTQKTSNIQKIPLLGDIPYLGAPFRRTITSNTKDRAAHLSHALHPQQRRGPRRRHLRRNGPH